MIKIEDLSFSFAENVNTLQNLNLNVPKGSVYGFLGSNGSGKSTTIRCILGLLRPQKGAITVFGKSITSHHNSILEKVGYLIEGPKFYGNLSCFENLALLKNYYTISNQNILEVLKRVGLWDAKNKLYGACSTGMKQRLGIAKSFVHHPDLLILDEPLNGLDPEWIAETRMIIKELNRDFGTTILLSSHLLFEMEKVATHIGILRNGSLEFEGTVENLLSSGTRKLTVVVDQASTVDTMLFPPEFNLKKYKGCTYEFTVPSGLSLIHI